MVVIGGVVRTGLWARSAAVLSFGFGCHALHVCFRVGRVGAKNAIRLP